MAKEAYGNGLARDAVGSGTDVQGRPLESALAVRRCRGQGRHVAR
ncbi:hypothetical protein [Streptomyces sp. NBC_00496]